MKTTQCLMIALLAAGPAAIAQVPADHALPPAQIQPGAGANDAPAGSDADVPAHGLNARPSFGPTVSAALSPSDTIRDIQNASFDGRESLLKEVSDRIDAGKKLVNSLQHNPRAAGADTHTEFNSGLDDVKVKEKILERSLKEGRSAHTEDDWLVAKTPLGADYEAYATAVAALNAMIQT
jgi:hypothetical protein